MSRSWRVWWCGIAIAGSVMYAVPVGAAATVPGPPTISSVTAGVQNARVAFVEPADDGGAAVFAYTVTCRTADGLLGSNRSGKASPLRVGGLVPGKSYACRVAARNAVGLGASSGVLVPVVPLFSVRHATPGAPTDIYATAESESILIDWTSAREPPGFRNVLLAHRGKCRSSDGGITASRRVDDRALIVGPLTPGKTYTCVVREENPNGFGPYSAPSNAVVPLPPIPMLGAPTITSVAAGAGRLIVSFVPPAYDGGQPILHYLVICVSSDGGAADLRTGERSPIVVLGLSPDKTYTCTVVAHNPQGDGPPSAPSAPVVTLAQ
ncbi:MAG TPA: fibronectin type III domain-containing protein [Acidimicrobiia bacterium]|nr:fibronectin type III domain-containing protein [Acidimicrobiia bacterium]